MIFMLLARRCGATMKPNSVDKHIQVLEMANECLELNKNITNEPLEDLHNFKRSTMISLEDGGPEIFHIKLICNPTIFIKTKYGNHHITKYTNLNKACYCPKI